MDSANGNVATAEAQSDTAAAAPSAVSRPPVDVGVKRPAAEEEEVEVENGGVVVEEDKEPDDACSSEKHKRKKLRNGCSEEDEEMMRRVAEIVLVLSAMVKMRGGREPTPAEKELMAEAREKVVAICEELAPRDVFPRESLGGIIEDLGLNRLKEDQKLGLRPPKPSLLEKIETTKRKMAESKSFAPQIASSPAPRPQAGNGAPSENPGIPIPPRAFQFEKPSSLPAASGGLQHSLPASNSPSTPSAMLSFQPPSNQVRPPMNSAGMPTSSSSTSGFSGPSPATQTPAGHVVKAKTLPLQPQTAPLGNIGSRNKAAEHPSFSSQGSAIMHIPPPQTAHTQTMKPTIIQGVPGSMTPMHRPIQGMHYAQTSHLFSRHLEVSKIVQKQLYPKPPERPAWISPSREYMTRTVTCQVCKSTINEMDNMFVCDACEKGYHLKCLPVSNQKVSPRGEWHCPRCLAISNGKPFPPKYGRVTRNANTTKITSNTSGVQSQKKPEAQSQAPPNQQNIATNVNPNEKISSHDGVGTESSGPNKKPKSEMDGTETSPDIVIKKELAGSVESGSAGKSGATKAVCLQGCGNLSTGQTVKSEPSFSEGRSGDTPKLDALRGLPGSDAADGPSDSSTPNHHPRSHASDYNSGSTKNVDETEASSVVGVPLQRNDCDSGASNGVRVSPQQQVDSSGLEKPLKRPEGVETGNCHPNHEDVKPCNQDSAQENQPGMKLAGTEAEAEAPAMASEDVLYAVDWVGDVNGVDDNKKFYLSCCINGVVYKVYDYVLIRSSDSKLVPYKIQAMWEDIPISSKWVLINQCYFPGDLPASVGRPSASEGNEVYESNHEHTLRAGLIQGPCEVLQAKRYGEDIDNGSQGAVENKDHPVFLCRWFYDKIKGVFRPIPS